MTLLDRRLLELVNMVLAFLILLRLLHLIHRLPAPLPPQSQHD